MRFTHLLKHCCLMAMATVAITVHADTVEDGRMWLTVNANGELPAQGWHWYAEVQPRMRAEGKHLDQVIIRPAIYYALTPQNSIWFGYAHVTSHPDGKTSFEENRLWQQYLHTFTLSEDVKLQSRTRLEQRFIEHADDTGHKLRQLLRLTMPSGLHERLQWVAYDEYFVNLNDTDYGARRGFDQNRAFVGGNWAVDARHRLEIGYLNQFVNGRRADSENHVLSATLSVNF